MREIVIAVIGSSAFSILVNAIVNTWNEKKKAKKGTDELVLFMVAATLNNMAETSLEKGIIKNERLKLFQDLLKLYKDKGGNGYIDALANQVSKLPIDFS